MGPRTPAFGLVVAALAAAAACGGGGVSAELAGTSRHFRLFVGSTLAGTLVPQDELARLETNWADTETLLRMPDGQIDYVLLPPEQIAAACEIPEAAGCEIHRTVYTSAPVDQHELNHAYLELRTAHRPHPLLVEGIAEAIGCGEGAAPPPSFDQVPDWPGLIADASYGEVYGPGRQLARYLILAHGAERFLSYYQQAPAANDPAAFSSNFTRFWALDLDTVWSAMQTAQPPWGPDEVLPICPCSRPSWSASDVPASLAETPSNPYWTWPSLHGETAAFAGYQGSFAIHDCARRDLREFTSTTVMFARLDGPLYASEGSAATVASDTYVADTCDEAAAYALPPEAVLANSSGSPISMAVDSPAETALSVYLALTAAVPMALGKYDGYGALVVCPDCETPDAACQPVPAYPASVQVTGRFYVHWTGGLDPAPAGWPYTFVSVWVSPGRAAAAQRPQRARVIW